MKSRADILSFLGLISAFGGEGVIEGFKDEIHDLVCFTATECHAETWILAFLKLVTGVAGIISAYYLVSKTSTPNGSSLAVIPAGQAPATVLANGTSGKAFALVNPGGAGDVTPVAPPTKEGP